MFSSFCTAFVAALQAGLSVLLVIVYGIIGAQYDLIDNHSAKKISQISVQLFLPFLLVTKVGKQLELETVHEYVPILSKTYKSVPIASNVNDNLRQSGPLSTMPSPSRLASSLQDS